MSDLFKYVQGHNYTLSGSGVVSNASQVTVQDFTTPDGTDLTMTDFGSIGYIVFEPGTAREENASFTGVTQNGDGTATLTGLTKGLKFVDPYDQDVNLERAHAGGTILRVSNTAQFYSTFANKNDTETITQVWTFTEAQRPILSADVDATLDTQLITHGELARAVAAGAVPATNADAGIIKISTDSQAFFGTPDTDGTYYFVATMNQQKDGSHQQRTNSFQYGESLSYGDLVYLKTSDSKWYKASALVASTANVWGICAQAGVLNDYNMIMLPGSQIDGLAGLTPGVYYLSDTAGALSTTAGTYAKIVGFAPTATSFFLQPVQNPPQMFSAIELSLSNTTLAIGNPGSTPMYGYNDQYGQISFSLIDVGGAGGNTLHTVYRPITTGQRSLYIFEATLDAATFAFNGAAGGAVQIGTDNWISTVSGATGKQIIKNTTGVSFSGTEREGQLGYDPTNSYLLVQYSTTKVAKFSGVAGTTLTNLNADVTLDNAVDENKAFIYDNVNSRYIFVDGTSLRRFDSTGTTIDTLALDATMMGNCQGVMMLDNTVYVIIAKYINNAPTTDARVYWQVSLVPTSMTR